MKIIAFEVEDWEREAFTELRANHVLMHLRNVFITPHSAFNTREAIERILKTTVENIVAFMRGSPQNVVQ